MNKVPYDSSFFLDIANTSTPSAAMIVGWLCEMAQPKSVLDVGCGQGTWLNAFSKVGVQELMGIDGDYVDTSRLMIPTESFRAADLAAPFALNRTFDLVICLEVAEHLPALSADTIVSSIAVHSDAVLFSAAVPNQIGTHHVNEQWPQYWVERFAVHGYQVRDVVRPAIWNEERVAPWYRQNILLFTRGSTEYVSELVRATDSSPDFGALPLVHPGVWDQHIRFSDLRVGRSTGPRTILAAFPNAIARAIASRLRGPLLAEPRKV